MSTIYLNETTPYINWCGAKLTEKTFSEQFLFSHMFKTICRMVMSTACYLSFYYFIYVFKKNIKKKFSLENDLKNKTKMNLVVLFCFLFFFSFYLDKMLETLCIVVFKQRKLLYGRLKIMCLTFF